MWVATQDLRRSAAHPFYARLNQILDQHAFDRYVERLCERFYADDGRPGLPPGRYFRLLLIGYFEGLDAERAIAWRAADSFALREFLGLVLPEAPPDHSTISRTRRLIDLETHEAVFTWMLQRLADAGLVKGKTVGIDATTLEANLALRSIVRHDTGESYQDFLTIISVTVQGADDGHDDQHRDADRSRRADRGRAAGRRWRPRGRRRQGLSQQSIARGSRGRGRAQLYLISEPDRGRRNWKKNADARDAVYRNRRRIRGARGQRLLRLRGERLERPFAHLYETGGMRRVHLRGHANIRKRLLIHTAGFNLGLLMRQLIGVGTPRGLQGRLVAALTTLITLIRTFWRRVTLQRSSQRLASTRECFSIMRYDLEHIGARKMAFTTGCWFTGLQSRKAF
jgi:transposase